MELPRKMLCASTITLRNLGMGETLAYHGLVAGTPEDAIPNCCGGHHPAGVTETWTQDSKRVGQRQRQILASGSLDL